MPINKLRKRLGDLLVEEGIVSEAQLEQALNAQKNTGRRLGDTLISLGFLIAELFGAAIEFASDRSEPCPCRY